MSSILVVDDDPLIRTLIEHKLRQRGFEVTSAESGEEGLRQAAAKRPDLIVLDAMMPNSTASRCCIASSRTPVPQAFP